MSTALTIQPESPGGARSAYDWILLWALMSARSRSSPTAKRSVMTAEPGLDIE
jgi:hypothetical protein